MGIVNFEELTEKLNKGQRSKFFNHLGKIIDGEKNVRIYLMSEFPTEKKKDTRPITIFVICDKKFYTLTDIPKKNQNEECLIDENTKKKDLDNFLMGINPDEKTEYVNIMVKRDKIGRKKRVLTDDEKKKINELSKIKGETINDIAKEMHISNRVVMQYLRLSEEERQKHFTDKIKRKKEIEKQIREISDKYFHHCSPDDEELTAKEKKYFAEIEKLEKELDEIIKAKIS